MIALLGVGPAAVILFAAAMPTEHYGSSSGAPQQALRVDGVQPYGSPRLPWQGLGIALEVPVVGVQSGLSGGSQLGVGYLLGGRISWDAFAKVRLRLALMRQRTYCGGADLRYAEGGALLSQRQIADWRAFDVSMGLAYLWRTFPVMGIAPYAGGALGAGFGGLFFFLDESLSKIAPIDAKSNGQLPSYAAVGMLWSTSAFVGIELELAKWLAAQWELTGSRVIAPSRSVRNTRRPREVETTGERVWLISGSFSFRFRI